MGFAVLNISEKRIWSVVHPLLSNHSHPASQILFLNKVDLFERKLQYSPINRFFPVRLPLHVLNSRPRLFGIHENRIIQVPRMTPKRARSTSKNGLRELPPRASTGKSRQTGPSLRVPTLPLGPCISSMSSSPLTLVEMKWVANGRF